MNILVTLDKNYLVPLRTMLGSFFINNRKENIDIYMISDGLSFEDIKELEKFSSKFGANLFKVDFNQNIFDDAPALRYYSKAMYYRLLAASLLPEDLDRILYIDPDVLVINEVIKLYDIDFQDKLFVAASHGDRLGLIDAVNRVRLSNYEAESYFNSGIMMMNLEKMRKEIRKEEIFGYIKKHSKELILPDQDALNALYGHRILEVDDSIWNYDARHFEKYLLESKAEKDLDWIIDNTVFLHFCGKNKPWHKTYLGYFSALYKHYQKLIERIV